MKKSSKVLIVTAVVISLIAGFLIGISIDYPKTDSSELAGTIGRLNNYRNVKVTEDDVKLRSELQSNSALLKNYQQYLSFHYTTLVKLDEDIKYSLKTAGTISEFNAGFSSEIEALARYDQTVEQARKDILLTLTCIQQLSATTDNNVGVLINNANIAIAQVKYKQDDVIGFVEAIEAFLKDNNADSFADLKKAHDLLTMNQFLAAFATKDKPMLKYLNKKEIYSSSADIKQADSATVKNDLDENVKKDIGSLQKNIDSKQLGAIYDSAVLENVEDQLGIVIPAVEKLGAIYWWSTEKLGMIYDSDKLGSVLNTEKLGMIYDSDKLGAIYNSDKLGTFDADKLGVLNVEKLGDMIIF